MLTNDLAAALIAGGETYHVEFKSERRKRLGDEDITTVIVCLANSAGGTLLIGVEDDGEVTGARPRHGEKTDVRLVDAMIAGGTVPSAVTQTQLVEVTGIPVLAIQVTQSTTPTSTSQGVYKKRAIGSDGKPACVPYPFHEMQSTTRPAFASDFSARVLPGATWDDLDPLEIARLRDVIRANPSRSDATLANLADAEMCRALRLVEGGGDTARAERVTVAGMLMLGRSTALQQFVPTHEVAFQVKRGSRVAVNDIYSRPLV